MTTIKTIYLLTALLTLQISNADASSFTDEASVYAGGLNPAAIPATIAPVTPREATFEEGVPYSEFNATVAPVTPVIADFEESSLTNSSIAVSDLAPVTPAVADFEEHI